MSSVEQKSTKGISLKFPPMASVPSTDKSNLVETPLATVIEHVQVQNTGAPVMYTVPVSNIALNQQQAEITQTAPEPLSATPTLQETPIFLETLLSLQQPETIPNSFHFEQDQISLHPRELFPEHVGDLDNQENFDPSSCQVVTELNGDTDRQQKISELFDQSLVSSSHQSKKRTTIEDNASEDGNLQLHEEIIDTIIGERQSRQNSGPGIISKLAVGIKKFWTEDSKNNSLFKGHKDQLAVPENCEYIKVPLFNDKQKQNIHYYYKRNDKKYAHMQQLLTQTCTAVINIANNCLEADKSNKIVEL